MNEIDDIKRRAGITEENYSADPQELIVMLRKRIDDTTMSDADFRNHLRRILPAFEPYSP
jgi:hypothetical protein